MKAIGENTAKQYEDVLARAIGAPRGLRAVALSRDMIDAINKSWPESSRKMLRKAIVRNYVEYGQEEIGRGLAKQIAPVHAKKRIRKFPSGSDMQAFVNAASEMRMPKVRVLMKLYVKLGLRAEDLLGVMREQVEASLKSGQLIVTVKGDKEHALPIKYVRDELRDLLALSAALPKRIEEQDGALWPWQRVSDILSVADGRRSAYAELYRCVKRVAKAAGLDPKDWSPHKLRHGFASGLAREGVPIIVIQALLGHEQLSTTDRYLHADKSDLEKYMPR